MTKQEIIKEYMATIGRKGGKAKTEKKTIALRANAKKRRKKK